MKNELEDFPTVGRLIIEPVSLKGNGVICKCGAFREEALFFEVMWMRTEERRAGAWEDRSLASAQTPLAGERPTQAVRHTQVICARHGRNERQGFARSFLQGRRTEQERADPLRKRSTSSINLEID
ncbi:hypothetical protein J6590_032662 [Homalodisca vitripennis]|nr:hypothetical protein J6590_032662 [Homalodisca vitripennis]